MTEWDLSQEEIRRILAAMIWSFSRINSSTCKYSWYLHYIAGFEDADSAFSQFGTVIHDTYEKYLKGELDMFDVSQYYQEQFSQVVTCEFPSNKYVDLREKAYEAGLEYFNNINFDFDRYEVLGVEKELNFKVGEYPFHGFADAVYRDKETGEIILVDHKTSSFKYLKNGGISKTNQEHFTAFKRQEYLYCIPLIEEYGKVDKLTWNMIRDQRIIEIPFNEKEFKEAQEWAIEQIESIKEEVIWLPDNSESYFCKVICGQRNSCPYIQ